jgi:hypothetical protein
LIFSVEELISISGYPIQNNRRTIGSSSSGKQNYYDANVRIFFSDAKGKQKKNRIIIKSANR